MKTLPTIKLVDGNEAVSFVPELTGKLAIVHLSVLQLLIANLNKANFEFIKVEFADRIRNTFDLPEMVSVAKAEVAFHETVNLIQQYTEDQMHPVGDAEPVVKTTQVAEQAPN